MDMKIPYEDVTYEQVFGCDLAEYLRQTGITFDDLQRIKEAEIAMLKHSLHAEVERSGTVTRLAEVIYHKIEQKKRSLKRHQEWFRRCMSDPACDLSEVMDHREVAFA